MSDRNRDTVQVFVCPAPSGKLALPAPHFLSLERALVDLEQQYGFADGGSGAPREQPRCLEIAYLKEPADVDRLPKKASHTFYYDPHLAGSDGDGSDRRPWPDVPTAVTRMLELHTSGKLELCPGERIVVSRREIFTPTSLESRKQMAERIAMFSFMCMAFVLVVPLVAILSYLVYKAWPALRWEFLTQVHDVTMAEGGIWAPLVGTFFLVLVSLAAAAPIGILAGVYLNEYARDNWFTRLINLGVVNLAGVPSIVHALFGVGAFVLTAGMGQSLLAASLTLAIMTLPVIITSTREALASVPMAFREACWNMGATRWQTIRTIVLPNSISGILTGVILQVARAAGETAPILFTGATFYMEIASSGPQSYIPYGLNDRVMALSMHLFALTSNVRVPEHVIYGTAVVLIGLVLAVNSASIALRVYLRSRKKW